MKDMGVRYEDATAFRKGDRWGYIHKSGEIYVEPEFVSAGRMSKEGKARLSSESPDFVIKYRCHTLRRTGSPELIITVGVRRHAYDPGDRKV